MSVVVFVPPIPPCVDRCPTVLWPFPDFTLSAPTQNHKPQWYFTIKDELKWQMSNIWHSNFAPISSQFTTRQNWLCSPQSRLLAWSEDSAAWLKRQWLICYGNFADVFLLKYCTLDRSSFSILFYVCSVWPFSSFDSECLWLRQCNLELHTDYQFSCVASCGHG